MHTARPPLEAFEDAPCPLCEADEALVMLRAEDRLRPQDPTLFQVVRCAGCGLAYTRPRPIPDAVAAFYPPSYGSGAQSGLTSRMEAAYRARQQREAVRWLADLRPARGRLLDVGCGRGDLLRALTNDGWQASGLEPSSDAVVAARAQGLDVTRGRCEDLAADAGPYHVVLFSGVVEHLHDPLGALRHARGLLAPAGLVAVLYLPLLDSPQARFLGARWLALDLPRHLTHFTHATFMRAARQAGLRVVARRTYSSRHNASQLVGSLLPSLQKHRLYLAEAQPSAGRGLGTRLAPAVKRVAYGAALTAARPLSRLEAAVGLTPMASYFLAPEPGIDG